MHDRENEWASLARFVTDTSPGASLGVVWGRRRQGKTFLLKAVCEQTGGFYFEATQTETKTQLEDLGQELGRYLNAPAPFAFGTWEEALRALLRLGEAKPFQVVVLDEIQYIISTNPEFPSTLQRLLNPKTPTRTGSNARILLCGSAMSIMSELISGRAPLRGRASLDLLVQPFNYRSAAQFWGLDNAPQVAFKVGAILGGTPSYLPEFLRGDKPKDASDFDNWVERSILSRTSPLFREARYLLAEDREIRDLALYNSVLAALVAGNETRTKIASYLGRKDTDLTYPLAVLEDLGLISKLDDMLRSNRPLYRVAEPVLRFYHAVMRPNWARLETNNNRQVWLESQPSFKSAVLGPHFEHLTRVWYPNSKTLRFPTGKIGHGVVNDPSNKTSHQLDLIAFEAGGENKPHIVAVGEAKLGQTLSRGDLDRLKRIAALIQSRTGYSMQDCQYVLASDGGFTENLTKEQDVVLADLATLYATPGNEDGPQI